MQLDDNTVFNKIMDISQKAVDAAHDAVTTSKTNSGHIHNIGQKLDSILLTINSMPKIINENLDKSIKIALFEEREKTDKKIDDVRDGINQRRTEENTAFRKDIEKPIKVANFFTNAWVLVIGALTLVGGVLTAINSWAKFTN